MSEESAVDQASELIKELTDHLASSLSRPDCEDILRAAVCDRIFQSLDLSGAPTTVARRLVLVFLYDRGVEGREALIQWIQDIFEEYPQAPPKLKWWILRIRELRFSPFRSSTQTKRTKHIVETGTGLTIVFSIPGVYLSFGLSPAILVGIVLVVFTFLLVKKRVILSSGSGVFKVVSTTFIFAAGVGLYKMVFSTSATQKTIVFSSKARRDKNSVATSSLSLTVANIPRPLTEKKPRATSSSLPLVITSSKGASVREAQDVFFIKNQNNAPFIKDMTKPNYATANTTNKHIEHIILTGQALSRRDSTKINPKRKKARTPNEPAEHTVFNPQTLEPSLVEKNSIMLHNTKSKSNKTEPVSSCTSTKTQSNTLEVTIEFLEPYKEWVDASTSSTSDVTTSSANGPYRPNLIRISSGSFQMGTLIGEPRIHSVEHLHKVTITDDYWLADSEVTQKQWSALMQKNPSHFQNEEGGGPEHPVERVSWFDALAYLNRLSSKESLRKCYRMLSCTGAIGENFFCNRTERISNCNGYRLPTEAEWEYAASARYETETDLSDIGWIFNNSNSNTHSVKQKSMNSIGLYDLTGNVWEWVEDKYKAYSTTSTINPRFQKWTKHEQVVFRGCGWDSSANGCRISYRNGWSPMNRSRNLGFRPARSILTTK